MPEINPKRMEGKIISQVEPIMAEYDENGNKTGDKKDENGEPIISKLNENMLHDRRLPHNQLCPMCKLNDYNGVFCYKQ